MSTQTANIGLHQWESTDNFLREDFNEDNRKIDQAIRQATDKSAQAVEQLSARLDMEVGQISDRLDTEIGQVTAKLNTEIGKLSTALDTEIGQVSDRLEEAVGTLADAQPLETLFSIVVREKVSVVRLDLTGIDQKKYHELRLYAEYRIRENTTSTFLMQLDGLSGPYYSTAMGNTQQGLVVMDATTTNGVLSISIPCAARCPVIYGDAVLPNGTPLRLWGRTNHNYEKTWEEVSALEFCLKSGTFADGCEFKLYGVRKI